MESHELDPNETIKQLFGEARRALETTIHFVREASENLSEPDLMRAFCLRAVDYHEQSETAIRQVLQLLDSRP